MRKLSLLLIVFLLFKIEIYSQSLIENYQGTGHTLPSETPINKFYIGFSSNDITNYPATYGSLFGYTNSSNGYGYSYQIYKGHTSPRLHIRFADYSNGGNKWYPWKKLLDSGNDIESEGILRINGSGDSYISGKLGLGILSPSEKFEINGNIKGPGAESSIKNFKNIIGRSSDGILHLKGGTPTGPIFLNYSESGNIILANGGGNVGIGTTNTFGYKLAVNGTIGAKEVKVEISSAWPDYVFSDYYKLKDLNDVESFVNEYEHLPDMPTTSEVEEKGINLGEMDAKLLQKIEELTLYMIEMNKRMNLLESENSELKKEIIELKSVK